MTTLDYNLTTESLSVSGQSKSTTHVRLFARRLLELADLMDEAIVVPCEQEPTP
jgi:hypothetical protein